MQTNRSPDVTAIVGARPQFIKSAAVSRGFRAANLAERLLHTGQHYDADMSEIFFDELDMMPPSANLGVRATSQGAMIGRMLEEIENDLQVHTPRAVVVYGDTNSTLAGALAAAKLQLPVVHVEAGLRSFNRAMPEEVNRILTDHVSTLLLCPTSGAVQNLKNEGIVNGVHHVGDVMYDAAIHALEKALHNSSILHDLALRRGDYVVATVHRAENTDNEFALRRVAQHLVEVSEGTAVVMPLHPRTRAALRRFEVELPGVMLVPPLGYLDMTMLVANAREVHTDSGGLQKEAYFHGVPCVTLRSETEWVETVDSGWNRLWSDDQHVSPRKLVEDYGHGDASLSVASLVSELIDVRKG